MANITIKNIPDELYEAIKQQAAANRRSINNEIIFLMERAVEQRPPDPAETLQRARVLREKLGIYVTEKEITDAKHEGRP